MAPDVRDGRIVEGANHVRQRVDVAQVADEGGFLQASWPMAATSTYSTQACVSFLGL